jgi:serine/threonine protein kinase/tetratricopeptide (TPR) repeat protein
MNDHEHTPRRLFNQALELADPAQRAVFLYKACAGDAALRQRVEDLLRAYEQAGDFLEQPPTEIADATKPRPASAGVRTGPSGTRFAENLVQMEKTGDTIGRYKLLEQIGEGGFGVVYVAEQREPVKRRVALKVIKLGMDTKQVIARFEAERQALAMMDHPNIARVLDAGATEAGRPFFVMELVRGIPITAYCDQTNLSTQGRLDLFVNVCQAIQHAHHKGVIHRDIKPSNILVTVNDGVPVPKVIDFGIAKATQGELTDKTVYTQFQQFIGTPAYTSPEQAEMTSLDIDTRSDIYSLGVLLYELLTGTTPFDSRELLASGLDEMRRTIREKEPQQPSMRVGKMRGEDLTSTARRRNLEPSKLINLLRGDLDWIVMKALEKDRTRRYETATSFAQDLVRHSNNEPVVARPPTVAYLVQKLFRRHKLAFAACGTIAVTLLAGILVSSWYAVEAARAEKAAVAERLKALEDRNRARQAEHQAREEKQKAQTAAVEARRDRDRALAAEAKANTQRAVAEETVDFLRVDLLAQASPVSAPEPDLKLRTALDRASEKIEGRFANRPMVEAGIRTTLARTYGWLGEYATMERHAQRSLELYRRELGETNAMVLAEMARLGEAYWRQGKYTDSIKLLSQALEMGRQSLGAEHPQTLITMNNLGSAYQVAGRPAEAVALFDETLKLRKARLGPDHPETLASMSGLASAYRAAGQLSESLRMQEETLELRRTKLGPDHPDTLLSMNNLAAAYRIAGRPAEAVTLFEETLKLQKVRLGPDHPNTLLSMNNLAVAYQNAGRVTEALPLNEETLKLRKVKLGPDHPDTLTSMNNLAGLYRAIGRLAEAQALYEETLKLRRSKLGPDHPDTLTSMSNLASACEQGKDYSKAESLKRELVTIRKQTDGVDSPATAIAISNLGVNLNLQKKHGEAESVLREALAGGPAQEDWTTFNTRSVLGAALLGQKKYAEAESMLVAGYEGMKRHEPGMPAGNRFNLSAALTRLVLLYTECGKPDKAAEWQARLDEFSKTGK